MVLNIIFKDGINYYVSYEDYMIIFKPLKEFLKN